MGFKKKLSSLRANSKNSLPTTKSSESSSILGARKERLTNVSKKSTSNCSPKDIAFLEPFIERYGDLVFDLCYSILWSQRSAQVAFQTVFKKILHTPQKNRFTEFERVWVLKLTVEVLLPQAQAALKRLSPSEQVMLDSSSDPARKLESLSMYFHRLGAHEKLTILLRDKYGIGYSEITAVMGIPEGSLKILRQQGLQALEGWIWSPE